MAMEIIQGNIVTFKADVLVNTIANYNKDPETCGALCKSFVSSGGPALARETKSLLPIEKGVVKESGSGRLNCKCVLHLRLAPWEAETSKRQLGRMLKKCMDVVTKNNHTSIAFPALGGGNMKYPPKEVFDTLTSVIDVVRRNNPHVKVYLVCFSDEQYKTFIRFKPKPMSSQAQRTTAPIRRQQPPTQNPPQSPPGDSQSSRPGWVDLRKYTEEEPTVPDSWLQYPGMRVLEACEKVKTDCLKVALKPGNQKYKNIEHLVKTLWNDSEEDIDILSIEGIENYPLYHEYTSTRKKFCEKHMMKPFSTLRGLEGELDVRTSAQEFDNLGVTLINEINERYLLHGTDSAEYIHKQGFDNRLAQNGNFGTGSYFAEIPAKAHQYTRESPRTMILTRVILGNIYVCPDTMSLKRPPCAECTEDECPKGTKHTLRYDSVLGHTDAREFVIYEQYRTYPEYIITYDIQWKGRDINADNLEEGETENEELTEGDDDEQIEDDTENNDADYGYQTKTKHQ